VKNVIVLTSALSGFGALAARVLARAGHTVYASMRETTGRNAPQVEEARKFAKDNNVDLRTMNWMSHRRHRPTLLSRRLSAKTKDWML
jgi:NAD(P)-dependent dehydrogenase (short-subunit alcohol dehydrogenase family)